MLVYTEFGLIKALLDTEEANNNVICVVVDVIILIFIDMPDLPYPYNIGLFSVDVMFIIFKL